MRDMAATTTSSLQLCMQEEASKPGGAYCRLHGGAEKTPRSLFFSCNTRHRVPRSARQTRREGDSHSTTRVRPDPEGVARTAASTGGVDEMHRLFGAPTYDM